MISGGGDRRSRVPERPLCDRSDILNDLHFLRFLFSLSLRPPLIGSGFRHFWIRVALVHKNPTPLRLPPPPANVKIWNDLRRTFHDWTVDERFDLGDLYAVGQFDGRWWESLASRCRTSNGRIYWIQNINRLNAKTKILWFGVNNCRYKRFDAKFISPRGFRVTPALGPRHSGWESALRGFRRQ